MLNTTKSLMEKYKNYSEQIKVIHNFMEAIPLMNMVTLSEIN